jgi:hypothetical protein
MFAPQAETVVKTVELKMKSELQETLAEFRAILLARCKTLFGENRDAGNTSGYCRSGSAALVQALRDKFPDCTWSFTGGYGDDTGTLNEHAKDYLDLEQYPGGLLDQDGQWRGHFWVEGKLPTGETIIVDVTADQFGHEQLIVTDVEDHRYRKNVLPQHDEKVWVVEPETSFAAGVYYEWSSLHTQPRWSHGR